MGSFSLSLVAPPKFSSWDVSCSDGKHTVTIERGFNGGAPFKLYVDTKLIDVLKPIRKGFILVIEYPFSCGDETLTVIFYGGQFDLLRNGELLNSKIKYEPQNILPRSYRLLLILFNWLSLISFAFVDFSNIGAYFYLFLSIMMAFSCAILILRFSTSPFYSKRKKIIYSLFMAISVAAFIVFSSRMGGIINWALRL